MAEISCSKVLDMASLTAKAVRAFCDFRVTYNSPVRLKVVLTKLHIILEGCAYFVVMLYEAVRI